MLMIMLKRKKENKQKPQSGDCALHVYCTFRHPPTETVLFMNNLSYIKMEHSEPAAMFSM